MKEKCIEIGTIQAFLDGELAPDIVEKVTHHIVICDSCAISLAQAQEESAFAFSALEQEFNTLVPTNRLWVKINDSIEKQGKRKSVWHSAFAFVSSFQNISNQTIAAFASLLILVGLFTSVLILRNNDNSDYVAEKMPDKQSAVKQISNPETTNRSFVNPPQFLPENKGVENLSAVNLRNDKKEFRAVKPTFISKENNSLPVKTNSRNTKIENPKVSWEVKPRTTNENLAGEESYIKTIATLTETVNSRKDEVLKPSARFAFEKDLAIVDDAIKKMKSEVKKNPKNEGAKQVLFSSYQNKIGLLNSVAEKTELMASLQ
ncbi:MAG: zf-HC2 domain-containing protein [Acidobacteria bacterium]|nr:zf-HC2 domain-containing protein [Acidobacteriota bacterium]MCA1639321.1 zf-HC2 domain-containing protein [Acidobacteriota bacterium]